MTGVPFRCSSDGFSNPSDVSNSKSSSNSRGLAVKNTVFSLTQYDKLIQICSEVRNILLMKYSEEKFSQYRHCVQ